MWGGGDGLAPRVHARLLLALAYILLETNALVAEPIRHLRATRNRQALSLGHSVRDHGVRDHTQSSEALLAPAPGRERERAEMEEE